MSIELALDQLLNYRTSLVNIYGLNLAPVQIENFLLTKGFTKIDLESNGWDVDFVITYTKDDLVITHSGNWYYGSSTLKLKKVD